MQLVWYFYKLHSANGTLWLVWKKKHTNCIQLYICFYQRANTENCVMKVQHLKCSLHFRRCCSSSPPRPPLTQWLLPKQLVSTTSPPPEQTQSFLGKLALGSSDTSWTGWKLKSSLPKVTRLWTVATGAPHKVMWNASVPIPISVGPGSIRSRLRTIHRLAHWQFEDVWSLYCYDTICFTMCHHILPK